MNPCNRLEEDECEEADQCDFQRGVCVWNQAPDNERNLYATYEWDYLYEEGEATTESFCYKDSTIRSKKDYTDLCNATTEEADCLNFGCKSFKRGKCKAEKKAIKCKKVGKEAGKRLKKNKGDEDILVEMEFYCNMYNEVGDGCTYKEKKGKGRCSGTIKF